MLGDSSGSLQLAADSGGDGAGVDGHDGGGVEREGGERGMFGGNRWPRQETVALLQIRSEMDALFRDSSAKGPLWDEISRKLAELGYHRSAKKCKEKFENVYKYHKRTRETRTGKQDGKNYRFFDQLEAFDSSPAAAATTPPQPPPQPPRSATIMPSVTPPVHHIMITSSTNFLSIPSSLPIMQNPTILIPQTTTINPNNIPTKNNNPFSNVDATSSSTFSDDGLRSGGGNKKKRKWKELFERLMKDVMDKQDELQDKFLDAIERRERERSAREDSWRLQEMARINKERELLAQERSMAAAKDTAVMAFLHKLAQQQNVVGNNLNFPLPSQPPPVSLENSGTIELTPQPSKPASPRPPQATVVLPPPPPPQPNTSIVRKSDNNNYMDNFASPRQTSCSSRWPKTEVEALIQLRTNLDSKYLENGPKGPLWEEISSAMKRLGYDRSSKRCKEKWENINKYFKKVKDSNKKRRDDAKTCPYFKQLDAIYGDRSSRHNLNLIDMAPLMVTPEQQWHPQQDQAPRNRDDDDVSMDDHLDDDDDDIEDDEGGEYEVVANANPSSNGATATI